VDPRICGTVTDDMTLSAMYTRCTYLNSFAWGPTDAPMTPLYKCAVSPNLSTFDTGGLGYVQPTALGFASIPFFYWHGDITYKIETANSSFHRGKYIILYEPNIQQNVIINANLGLNKQFSQVIDIQETQVLEICVKWANDMPWLRVGDQSTANFHSVPNLANGYIVIAPFTELQSPDMSSINFNVYVYSENMQYNVMTDANYASKKLLYTESCMHNVDMTCFDINDSTASSMGLCEDYFGEQPLSFRGLVKRYVTNQVISVALNTTVAPKSLQIDNTIFPVNNQPFSLSVVSKPDLFSYLRYAYLGIKGGIRVRYALGGNYSVLNTGQAKVSLLDPGTVIAPVASFPTTNLGLATTAGTITHIMTVNAGIDVELPYYSPNLFNICFSDDYLIGGPSGTMSDVQTWNFRLQADVSATSIPAHTVRVERAAAEDFSLIRFQGAPYCNV